MSAAHLPTTPPPASPGARTLAVYPGSFDPITLGHVDVVARALTLFDRVVVVVADNAAKAGRHLLSAEERVDLARCSLAHLEGVEVDVVDGLVADYCRSRGATAIVKGLRSGTDLDVEAPMALLNRELGAPRPCSSPPTRRTRTSPPPTSKTSPPTAATSPPTSRPA